MYVHYMYVHCSLLGNLNCLHTHTHTHTCIHAQHSSSVSFGFAVLSLHGALSQLTLPSSLRWRSTFKRQQDPTHLTGGRSDSLLNNLVPWLAHAQLFNARGQGYLIKEKASMFVQVFLSHLVDLTSQLVL